MLMTWCQLSAGLVISCCHRDTGSLRTYCYRIIKAWSNWREMGKHWVASAQGILTSLSRIGSTWRNFALIGVPPRRWLLISWLSLYRAVDSESWEITSWVGWDALNPKQMWLVWAVRSPARSLLRRVMQMTSAILHWLTTKIEPRFWHNSIDTIVPQECVGVYIAYAESDILQVDVLPAGSLQVDVLLVYRQTAFWSIFLWKIQM